METKVADSAGTFLFVLVTRPLQTLFVTQSNEWIDAGGAAGGDVAGQKRDRDEDDCYACVSQRIIGADSEEQARKLAR